MLFFHGEMQRNFTTLFLREIKKIPLASFSQKQKTWVVFLPALYHSMIAAYTYICCITSLKKTPLYRSQYCSFGDPGARNVSICKKGQSLITCIKANSEVQIERYISESINMIIDSDKQTNFEHKIIGPVKQNISV